MEYCLCVKPNDKNLLHIVRRRHMHLDAYVPYEVIATAEDEAEAFEAVAALLQEFCDAYGTKDFSGLKAWLTEVRR